MDYTTDALIASVRRRASVPDSQQLFDDSDLVLLLSDELQSVLVPKIMAVNEEYFVTYADTTTVANQEAYDIPSRAVAGKLREIAYVSDDGNSFGNMTRLSVEQISNYFSNYNGPSGFYPRGNEVVIYPTPTQVATIRMWFFDRPFTLTTVVNSGRITSINTGTNEIVVDNVPSGWTVGTSLSIVKGKPGFDTRFHETDIIALSSPTIELASVDGLEVGDYVSEQGYSCIAQIPYEAHHVLAQAGAVKVLEALGDREGMKIAQAKYDQLEAYMINIITPRVDGSPRKINNLNRGIFNNYSVTQNRGF